MKRFKGNIHNIETFGTFDGPGIRYVLFMQGCPFQCQFCHNRDSWSTKTNSLMSVEDVLNDYANYESFYKKGGLTVSGGEPLLQSQFVNQLFQAAKSKNIHTTLDTSAACYSERKKPMIRELLDYTDLVLLDVKHVDESAHKSLTGSTNKQVFAFLDLLEETGKKVIVRHVLIPSINDDTKSIDALKNKLIDYPCIEKIEVLPYHSNGKHKWEELGLQYPLNDIPDMDKVTAKNVERYLNETRYKSNDKQKDFKNISQ